MQEASAGGASLVVLPEMWNCPYSNDSFPSYAEDIDAGASQSAAALSEAAREHAVTLVGGSIPERSEGKLYNTCLVYSKEGKLLAKHRKVTSTASTLAASATRDAIEGLLCECCATRRIMTASRWVSREDAPSNLKGFSFSLSSSISAAHWWRSSGLAPTMCRCTCLT